MKSHATAILMGAALLSAAAAVAQTPTTPGRAMKGTLIETTVASTNVPAPAPRRGEANAVPITYYLPKNYDANRAERYPLLIQLHGGGGSNKDMENFRALSVGGGMGGLLDQAIENGLVAPIVSVMPSAGRAFYMNFRDSSQKWEDFVMKDLLPYMRKNFNVVQGREGTFITGISMGGMGSLRMAVKYPEVFRRWPARNRPSSPRSRMMTSHCATKSVGPTAPASRIASSSYEFTVIRSTRIIGQPTIPLPSSRRTLRAS